MRADERAAAGAPATASRVLLVIAGTAVSHAAILRTAELAGGWVVTVIGIGSEQVSRPEIPRQRPNQSSRTVPASPSHAPYFPALWPAWTRPRNGSPASGPRRGAWGVWFHPSGDNPLPEQVRRTVASAMSVLDDAGVAALGHMRSAARPRARSCGWHGRAVPGWSYSTKPAHRQHRGPGSGATRAAALMTAAWPPSCGGECSGPASLWWCRTTAAAAGWSRHDRGRGPDHGRGPAWPARPPRGRRRPAACRSWCSRLFRPGTGGAARTAAPGSSAVRTRTHCTYGSPGTRASCGGSLKPRRGVAAAPHRRR